MVSWIATVLIGLIIAVVGGIIAIIGKTDTSDFTPIGSGIAVVGAIILILGFVTKVKHEMK